MKKKIITKKELTEIQKYWNQQGGFGGELSSGSNYNSKTSCFGRIGILTIFNEDYNSEDLEIEFYRDDTIEQIEKRIFEILKSNNQVLTYDEKLKFIKIK